MDQYQHKFYIMLTQHSSVMTKKCLRKTEGVKRKSVSLSPNYFDKITKIKEKLGLSSDSEVIRRAIDDYAKRLGIL